MIEHITLLTYLYTRLDPILLMASFLISVPSLFIIVLIILYFLNIPIYDGDSYKSKYGPQLKFWCKVCLCIIFCGSFTKLVVPSKEDALLIAGVTIGVNVAEKTIDTMSKSETIGKVFEIVDLKVSKTLDDLKAADKEKK